MIQTPETPNNRLDRLEAALGRFAELTIQNIQRHDEVLANVSETVVAHNDTIDVLVANISQLTENVNRLSNNVDNLTINVQNMTDQAAQDRQQAAIDRQEFRRQMEQRELEIRQIWEYLRDRNGGSSPPQR